MIRTAFQGERGAFSEEAARKLLGDAIEPLACVTFDDVFDAVARGEAACAVVPIENSLADQCCAITSSSRRAIWPSAARFFSVSA
ncbi:MAG TPA: prephenate dehydratase domain-containing protein [Thermoanaerobaculia bacterium]|nr:prephenate dehydratase domain-containing protein [Thermoanaerobaculia bacterium]